MAERRLLSKYAPPHLDPWEIIMRRRQPSNQPIKVRIHLPMSLRCDACRNYIYERTKVNSRKEVCIGEIYMGTQIFRFSFKCNRCSAKITLKTDPQNSDYTVESGATRHVEPLCEEDETNGSSELLLNPTDILTTTNVTECSSAEGNKHSTLSNNVNPCKKQKTEPTIY